LTGATFPAAEDLATNFAFVFFLTEGLTADFLGFSDFFFLDLEADFEPEPSKLKLN
jgi:hypothetical protein